MGKKFKSTSDMYRSKARDRRHRGAVPTGCMVAILQYISIGALFALCLSMVF